jgi:hypothetical protein
MKLAIESSLVTLYEALQGGDLFTFNGETSVYMRTNECGEGVVEIVGVDDGELFQGQHISKLQRSQPITKLGRIKVQS